MTENELLQLFNWTLDRSLYTLYTFFFWKKLTYIYQECINLIKRDNKDFYIVTKIIFQ